MSAGPLLSLIVKGRPRTQGSMSLWKGSDGKERAKYSAETVGHRNHVIAEVQRAWGGRDPLRGEVGLQCEFRFARPLSHYGTGKNVGLLKPTAPRWMLGRIDVDKMLRLAGDALTIAGVLVDDSQIVVIHGEKVWCERAETAVEVWSV